MATYAEIIAYVRTHYGFVPKTCWIADVKEQEGFAMRRAPNRIGTKRLNPCPPEKREAILQAIRSLG